MAEMRSVRLSLYNKKITRATIHQLDTSLKKRHVTIPHTLTGYSTFI